jgi:hypothetical protein
MILTIGVPFVHMARDIMILMRATLQGQLEGVRPEIKTFLG